MNSLCIKPFENDLAGVCTSYPGQSQILNRVRFLIDRYLEFDHLHDRLKDLPLQFENPQPRPWRPISWSDINQEQVVGIDLNAFLSVLEGAINTEAPIRHYTQTSRQYLEHLHPQLARFVGGTLAEDGSLVEPGLWEKEERQHTPALTKIYTQLSGRKVMLAPHQARSYQPSDNPQMDLYRHGLHRVATEYGATCLYLWLMAHTTGPLQAVLEELTRDEINHMTKFWGFGVWAYPDSSFMHISLTLLRSAKGRLTYSRDRSSLIGTLHRMTQELSWQSWSWSNRFTFILTCVYVLNRLCHWNSSLTPDYLQTLFGAPKIESL